MLGGTHKTPQQTLMDSETRQKIQAYARAIAALLYGETAPEQLTTLEGIETAVRGHILEHVSPEIGHFLLQKQAAQNGDELGTLRVSSEGSASRKSKRKNSKSKGGHN